MSRIVVLRENGAITVLTEAKRIRSLVVDRNTGGPTPCITLEGAPAAVFSVLNGIPKVLPERVKAIFDEVSAQRSLPSASPAAELPPDMRRLAVLVKQDGAPSILVGTPTIQVLLVDRDHPGGAVQLQVEGAPATISTLYQVAPDRIDHIFAELAPQIETVIGAPELVLKDRVQLTYLTRNWFSVEETCA